MSTQFIIISIIMKRYVVYDIQCNTTAKAGLNLGLKVSNSE